MATRSFKRKEKKRIIQHGGFIFF